ncbi:metalloproteinase inhibitor 3-like [Stylophora pistillata]|nr:metalloproteinase inhibitor 3-like [Stylophora pistillata]
MASILHYMTLLLCAVALSEGCSCRPTSPPAQEICIADFGIKGKVLLKHQPQITDTAYPSGLVTYRVKVLKTFKGSAKVNGFVNVTTPATDNLCGVKLEPNETYVLVGRKHLQIGLCDWHKPWKHDMEKQIQDAQKKCD